MADIELGAETKEAGESVEAGWYPDPQQPDIQRYWDGSKWGEEWNETPERARPTGKANRLAVTALILSCLGPVLVGGILASIFGTVALDEIKDSEGKERGKGIAQWAVGLGLINIVVSCVVIVLVVKALKQ